MIQIPLWQPRISSLSPFYFGVWLGCIKITKIRLNTHFYFYYWTQYTSLHVIYTGAYGVIQQRRFLNLSQFLFYLKFKVYWQCTVVYTNIHKHAPTKNSLLNSIKCKKKCHNVIGFTYRCYNSVIAFHIKEPYRYRLNALRSSTKCMSLSWMTFSLSTPINTLCKK